MVGGLGGLLGSYLEKEAWDGVAGAEGTVAATKRDRFNQLVAELHDPYYTATTVNVDGEVEVEVLLKGEATPFASAPTSSVTDALVNDVTGGNDFANCARSSSSSSSSGGGGGGGGGDKLAPLIE